MEAAAYPDFPEYAGYSSCGGTGGSHAAAAGAAAADGLSAGADDGNKRRCPRRIRTGVLSRLMTVFEPSKNRLSMKIFGSEKAVLKERLRQQSLRVWVIHPCSKFRCLRVQILLIFYHTYPA